MAMLESGPVAFELKVMSAWAHGQVYALDWRWHGRSLLDPSIVRSWSVLGHEPKGWLICEGREYALPSAIFRRAAQIEACRHTSWSPPYAKWPPRTRIEVMRYPADEPDVFGEFRVTLRFDAEGFVGAITNSAGGPQDYQRLGVALSLEANLEAIERFGTELEEEIAERVDDSRKR